MYNDIFYKSADGLTLYARDYACRGLGADDAPTILCMHGLSRNSKDFANIAADLSQYYRVVAVDQRGRGRSQYDPDSSHYNPATYCQDMFTLLDTLNIPSVSIIGTSMGGLMSFLMTTMAPERIDGVVVNDIGPEVNPVGLARIQSYVGKLAPPTTWGEAIEQVKSINGPAFPDFTEADWAKFTQNLYIEDRDGALALDYDAAISKPMDESKEAAVPPDLWQFFEALKAKPMLLVHGALSDILSTDCAERMCAEHPCAQYLRLENRGHAPTLDEPESRIAIHAFFKELYSN